MRRICICAVPIYQIYVRSTYESHLPESILSSNVIIHVSYLNIIMDWKKLKKILNNWIELGNKIRMTASDASINNYRFEESLSDIRLAQ